uniref:DUF4283 domain-containing protein n=1 Tax=Cannabis sativa TaxID=3483 RepID=A0A803NVH1_CANSA
MASSSQHEEDLVDRYAQIQLEEEEGGVLIADEQEKETQAFDDRWCLVGKFLTGRTIDFDVMRHMLASLWQPGKGVYIKELDTNRYLFQFYHELDIQAVIDGSPWTFNRLQLIFHRLNRGEDPRMVRLHKLDMWVQLHDLKYGFMSEWVVKHVGNYIGTFVKTDAKNFVGIWRDYLRVRVTVDIEKPLKRRMKLIKQDGTWIWTTFKYEHVPILYGEWMKAPNRKKNYLIGAQWLRTGREEEEGGGNGGERDRSRGVGSRINDLDSRGSDGVITGGILGNYGITAKETNQREKMKEVVVTTNNESINTEENVLAGQLDDEEIMILENKRRHTTQKGNMEAREEEDSIMSNTEEKRYLEKLRLSFTRWCFFLDSRGKSGGVNLLWKVEEEVTLLGYGSNYIDVSVSIGEQGSWRLTGLYGEPNRSLRHKTWNLMRTLKPRSNLPWCIIGDLNNVASQQDKRGGNPYPNRLIEEAVVTQTLVRTYSLAKLINLEISTSDHCPIHLLVETIERVAVKRFFRFENSWLREPLCFQIVKDIWDLYSNCSVIDKIQYCGEKLIEWGQDFTGNFKDRIKKCKEEMKAWKTGRDLVSIQNYKTAEVKLQEVLLQKEIFWRQRSKQLWLREGDQNSKYFHAMASSRRRNNSISKLKRKDGTWADWSTDLSSVIVDYFSQLFMSSTVDCMEVVRSIPRRVSDEQNNALLAAIEDDEVRKALRDAPTG